MLCIKNGLLHTVAEKEPFTADILVDNGKIIAIGTELAVPENAEIIDISGLSVYPGFVDAHCHTGMEGYGIGYEGEDINEMNDPVMPQLRAVDAINPMDPTLKKAALAGVTCIATGPGSANTLGGTFAAIKTHGKRVDDMIVRDPIAMKCAFGENPKRCYRDKHISTRMSTAALIREALQKATIYMKQLEAAGDDISKRPAYDAKSEALLPVLRREIPLKAHAHQANDIFTALRIAKEFNLDITLEHVTEGHLIVDELAKENVPLAVGPLFWHATKFELQNRSNATPGILAAAGCQVSIITDATVIPQEFLPMCAGLAVRSGMDEYEALKAITINPAKHIGIADRVGTLEIGKDADIVITNGNPFSTETQIQYVFIDGEQITE